MSKDPLAYRDFSAPRKTGTTLRFIFWAFIGMACLGFLASFTKNPQTPAPKQSGASQASLDTMALIINISGNLCAEITKLKLSAGDTYHVTCIRYRDDTGIATYEVNAATGEVK